MGFTLHLQLYTCKMMYSFAAESEGDPMPAESWASSIQDDNAIWQSDLLVSNRLLVAVLLCVVLYSFYYLVFVVNKPRVFGGGKLFRKHILKHCPAVTEHYWPTFWAFQCHLTTVLRVYLQRQLEIVYKREILVLSDGGEVALDWAVARGTTYYHQEEDRAKPVLLILPGITGCSDHNYIKYLAQDGLMEGYRPVVFNQRGNGGVPLKTLHTYCASNISDLFEVTHRIHSVCPGAPVVGIGVSLGGMLLVQYLHQLGKDCDIEAVISISSVWDPHISRVSLEDRLDNKLLYSRFMAGKLTGLVEKNTNHLSSEQISALPFNREIVLKSTTVSEFDSSFTAPMFGYQSLNDYYNACRNSDKMHRICRPYICLTSADDPFVPKDSLPLTEFEHNPQTLLVLTSHGGHFGFLEGLLPSGQTWMNRIARQFLFALKSYKE